MKQITKIVTLREAGLLLVFIGIVSLFFSLLYAQPKAPPHIWDKGKIKQVDISAYPERYKKGYALFIKKCSNCHPITRPLNATYKGAVWAAVIKRMITKPEANISKQEGKQIYDFLVYYSKQK